MSKLERVRATGLRSIREVDLDVHDLNILIGANGSGKSNFIKLFRLVNDLVEERLQVAVATAGGANALLHYGRKVTPRITLDFEFGRNGYACSLVPTADDNFIFESEKWRFHGDYTDRTITGGPGSGHRESGLRRAASGPSIPGFVYGALSTWKIYHFHDTSDSAGLKQLGSIDDNFHLRPDASNLAAFLFLLQRTHPDFYRNIVDTVRLSAPFLKDLVLRPSPLNPKQIKLEWQHEGSDAYFDASSLSDGTIRLICLSTLLLQPSLPSVVLLDEPELGLHPAAVNDLASLLRRASSRAQVIVSTQSVTLVNHLRPGEIVVADRVQGASTFRRLGEEEIASWLDEYALGELWEKNILSGRP